MSNIFLLSNKMLQIVGFHINFSGGSKKTVKNRENTAELSHLHLHWTELKLHCVMHACLIILFSFVSEPFYFSFVEAD